MNYKRPLPHRPEFHPGDDLLGYARALTDLWDVPLGTAADWLGVRNLKALDPDPSQSWNQKWTPMSETEFQSASRAMGVHVADLEMSTIWGYRNTQVWFTEYPGYGGRDAVSRSLEKFEHAVCFACLSERPYARPLLWRYPLLPVCLRHRLVLQDSCGRCGGFPRDWVEDAHLSRCDCSDAPVESKITSATTIPGLWESADLVQREIQWQLSSQSPRYQSLDLTTVTQLLMLLVHFGAERDRSYDDPRLPKSRCAASALPHAVQIATSPPTRLDEHPVLADAFWTIRYVARGQGAFDATARLGTIAAAFKHRRGFCWQSPREIEPWNSSARSRPWPQLLPEEIYRVELSYLMHDALASVPTVDVDWEAGRIAAAILTAAWRWDTDNMTAAVHLNVDETYARIADQVVRVAIRAGFPERLELAIVHASHATGSWLYGHRNSETRIRAAADRMRVPPDDFERWLLRDYLCRLDALPDENSSIGG